MLTRKKLVKLFALLVVFSLLISACDRPLPPNNDDPTPTDVGYPAPEEGSTTGEQEQVAEPEPTREVIEEETTGETEEGGEETAETGEETAGEGEETTEGETAETGEETAGEGGETAQEEATPEVMAEGETGQEEGEAPSEEGSGEEAGEVAEGESAETPEETADGEPVAEAEEVAEGESAEEAETTEETAPETAEEAVPETAEPVAQPLPATHTVAAGENLYRIGLLYNISWVAIAQHNGITNPDRIYVGQVLMIPSGAPSPGPGGQPEPVPTPMGIDYIVKPGDTLSEIAKQFGVSVMEIAEANGLVNPNQIYAGQLLKIPVDQPTPPPVVHHIVKPGETLFRISLQYGVSWLAIAHANNIHPPYIIYAGQTLIIPGGPY